MDFNKNRAHSFPHECRRALHQRRRLESSMSTFSDVFFDTLYSHHSDHYHKSETQGASKLLRSWAFRMITHFG